MHASGFVKYKGQTMKLRAPRLDDADALAELCTELGYPTTRTEIERRLPELLGCDEVLLRVATNDDDRPIAWLQAVVRYQLEADPFVHLTALVVSESARSQGLGAQLVNVVEVWAASLELSSVRVSSNLTRERAHAFYLRAGYTVSKTSHLFEKKLTGE